MQPANLFDTIFNEEYFKRIDADLDLLFPKQLPENKDGISMLFHNDERIKNFIHQEIIKALNIYDVQSSLKKYDSSK